MEAAIAAFEATTVLPRIWLQLQIFKAS